MVVVIRCNAKNRGNKPHMLYVAFIFDYKMCFALQHIQKCRLKNQIFIFKSAASSLICVKDFNLWLPVKSSVLRNLLYHLWFRSFQNCETLRTESYKSICSFTFNLSHQKMCLKYSLHYIQAREILVLCLNAQVCHACPRTEYVR